MGFVVGNIFGALLGLIFRMALSEREYSILIGAVVGLLISVSIDFFAGSSIILKDKLSDIFICSFIGWGFRFYLRQIILGGVFGGVIGFGWGLKDGHWFGQVYLEPSLLNASLLFMQMSIIGMALGSLFMKSIGQRFLANQSQTE